MKRLVRRLLLWAVPELRATVEREQWLALFQGALQQAAAAQHVARHTEMN